MRLGKSNDKATRPTTAKKCKKKLLNDQLAYYNINYWAVLLASTCKSHSFHVSRKQKWDMGAAQPTKIKAKDAKKTTKLSSMTYWWLVCLMIIHDSIWFSCLPDAASICKLHKDVIPATTSSTSKAVPRGFQPASVCAKLYSTESITSTHQTWRIWRVLTVCSGRIQTSVAAVIFQWFVHRIRKLQSLSVKKKQDKANRTNMNKSHFHGSLCVDQQQHGVGPYRICLGTAMAGRYNLVISGVSPEELLQCCSC